MLLQSLSPSERRVAISVARGKRNREVARELGKSLRTVEFQLNAIYRKLGLPAARNLPAPSHRARGKREMGQVC